MKKQLAERIYADHPEEGARSVVINILKLCAVIAGTILITELLLRLGFAIEALLMIYMLAMVVVSLITPSYAYGIVAAGLCSFAYDFFITEPRLGFSISLRFPITLLAMLAVTLLISTLIIQNKKQADLALKREQRAELLYDLNQSLLGAGGVEEIVKVAQDYIRRQLNRSTVFYLRDPREGGQPQLLLIRPEDGPVLTGEEERKRAHKLFKTGARQPEDLLEEVAGEGVHYVAAVSRGRVLAIIGVDCREKELTSGGRTFLQIVAAQVAQGLALRYMSDEKSDLKLSAEKEKMRSNLLRSISHDLRTPLTGILGASTAILEQKDMPVHMREQLVGDIRGNAQWLIRMVENILTVTRISEETATVQKTLEAAEEVVAQAVAIVRGRFPDCHIHVSIPDELLLVPMDATLISQVLINLLENAVKNAEEGSLVLLTLKKKGDTARFEVSDHGCGISEHLLSNLFEIHTQYEDQTADSSRGIGIGLSICKTIIQAHGGEIEGCNRDEGGARFTFTLPLEKKEEPHEQ